MIILSVDLIGEYHELIKEDYPNITKKQLKEICDGPFKYLKEEMEGENLTRVRLKYFGVFQVYPKRARKVLGNIKRSYIKGITPQKKHDKMKRILSKYIDNEENKEKSKK